MSDPRDDELDPELGAYVAAYARVERPDPARVRDNWRAIEARVGAPSCDRRGPWLAVALLAAAAVLVLAVSMARRVADHDDAAVPSEQTPYGRDQDAAPSDAAVTAGAPSDAAVPPVKSPPASEGAPADAAPPVVDEVPVVEPAAPAPTRRRARPQPVQRPAPELEPSALAQETGLIGRIKAAVAAGRHADALALVSEHARRFPRGAFAHERTLAKARALCGAGDAAQARAVADAFVAAHPRSHLVGQMESVCPP